MAKRRMFTSDIISSARFLRMPTSARLLYYDLGMHADDDGVVEAFTVMRMTGANEEDLLALQGKGFVRILNDDLVTLIVDWEANNSIRKDRYTPSIYTHLLVEKTADSNAQPTDNQTTTNAQPTDGEWLSQDRIGKDRLGKDRLDMCVSIDTTQHVDTTGATHTRGFTPPTHTQISVYAKSINKKIDAQRFIDHYSAKGWMIGKTVMQDWKAAVRLWEDPAQASRASPCKPSKTVSAHNYEQRTYAESDFDDLFIPLTPSG